MCVPLIPADHAQRHPFKSRQFQHLEDLVAPLALFVVVAHPQVKHVPVGLVGQRHLDRPAVRHPGPSRLPRLRPVLGHPDSGQREPRLVHQLKIHVTSHRRCRHQHHQKPPLHCSNASFSDDPFTRYTASASISASRREPITNTSSLLSVASPLPILMYSWRLLVPPCQMFSSISSSSGSKSR